MNYTYTKEEYIELCSDMLDTIPLTAKYYIDNYTKEKVYEYFMSFDYYFISNDECDICKNKPSIQSGINVIMKD